MNVVDTIIKILDPHWYKCANCGGWVHIENPEKVVSTYCKKCMEKSYEKFAMPLGRSYYPKTIAKDLFSVESMEGPTGLAFELKHKYEKKS